MLWLIAFHNYCHSLNAGVEDGDNKPQEQATNTVRDSVLELRGGEKNVFMLQSVPSGKHVGRRDNEKDRLIMLLRSSMVQPSTWLSGRTEQGLQAGEELHDAAELPVYLDVLHPGRAVADDAAISCSRACTGSEQQTQFYQGQSNFFQL